MKALAIVALVFGALSIFIPVGGVLLAMLCSLMAMISFRSQPTLSGITFGINTINTAFLSPSIMLSDVASSGAFVGFHLMLLAVALVWRLAFGAPKKAVEASV